MGSGSVKIPRNQRSRGVTQVSSIGVDSGTSNESVSHGSLETGAGRGVPRSGSDCAKSASGTSAGFFQVHCARLGVGAMVIYAHG